MDITRQSLADPLPLASRLIACPSITPATGAVFTVLEEALVALGFEVDRFVSGDAPDGPVENLLALRHQGEGAHFAFAGHLDVVPPGNEIGRAHVRTPVTNEHLVCRLRL